jgi:hypothetical protein
MSIEPGWNPAFALNNHLASRGAKKREDRRAAARYLYERNVDVEAHRAMTDREHGNALELGRQGQEHALELGRQGHEHTLVENQQAHEHGAEDKRLDYHHAYGLKAMEMRYANQGHIGGINAEAAGRVAGINAQGKQERKTIRTRHSLAPQPTAMDEHVGAPVASEAPMKPVKMKAPHAPLPVLGVQGVEDPATPFKAPKKARKTPQKATNPGLVPKFSGS